MYAETLSAYICGFSQYLLGINDFLWVQDLTWTLIEIAHCLNQCAVSIGQASDQILKLSTSCLRRVIEHGQVRGGHAGQECATLALNQP